MKPVMWVLESDVFPASHPAVRNAIQTLGHKAISWNDDWLSNQDWPALDGSTVVFHGSLGNAAAISERLPWRPGAYCDVVRFNCSEWYNHARKWLIHEDWRILPADQLVAQTDTVFDAIKCSDKAFVRPDSPLKPFSGRVLQRNQVSLDSLDHGFYYDDPALPVVVAPVCNIGREWRFVIVLGRVVAGSGYSPETWSAIAEATNSAAWEFAAVIAAEMEPPEDVYVLDVCEMRGQLRLLELNPFSGADLYACDALGLVAVVSEAAGKSGRLR